MAQWSVLAFALGAGLAATAARGEPAEIGGHDAAWWKATAAARAAEMDSAGVALAACEEREAPPAYRNVVGQVFRGRDGLRYREIRRCDGEREALAAAEAAADELEDRAREQGVPPGWLR